MINKQHTFSGAIAIALLFAFPVSEGNAQDDEERPPGARAAIARIEEHRNARQTALDQGAIDTGLISLSICQDFFTVDYVEPGTDPHMSIGDRFLIVGPNPVSGQFQVTAVDPHEWKGPPVHYQAVPTIDPDEFDLWTVVVDPHNGGPATQHYYQMEITDRDPVTECPDYVLFKFVAHIPGPIILDPGHGGAIR